MSIIAISQRTTEHTPYQETYDSLDQRWHDLLLETGIIPLLIPNHLENAKKVLTHIPCSGLLLTGGDNSPTRMTTELWLLKHAIAMKLPVLGICHGMQVIQHYYGITLHPVSGHVTAAQDILINGEIVTVNSYHNYGTTCSHPQLHVWANALDNTIKALRHISLPIYGMMWHPERNHPYAKRDLDFIKQLFGEGNTCELSY